MKTDYLSLKRATTTSLSGLGVQAVLGVALLVYALMASQGNETDAAGAPLNLIQDHAALSAAIFTLMGLPLWGVLAIVFDQRRRAAIEALEIEALAADTGSSAFEASATDADPAARRVAIMQKFLIPGVALTYGAVLMLIGFMRFDQGLSIFNPDNYLDGPGHRGWAIAVTLGVAFIGFVFGRYIAGMSRHPAWVALKSGATSIVGAALFALLIAAGSFLTNFLGLPDVFARMVPAIVPAVMFLLGLEVFVNFLLDLYRPRASGETPRPAFESRLLGLFAAPEQIAQSVGEAINYQLGIDVTGNWFYRLISRSIATLVVLTVVFGWLLTSLVVVQPDQRGLLVRFGQLVDEDVGPGPTFKLPWPIDRVEIPEFVREDTTGRVIERSRTVTGLQVLHLGTPPVHDADALLWTNSHGTEERFSLVQPSVIAGSTTEVSQDPVLIATEVPLYFRVSNVRLYDRLGAPGERERLLEVVGQRVVNRYLSQWAIDEVLATARREIIEGLESELIAAYAGLNDGDGAGIEIVDVGMHGMHPPQDAAEAFEQVVQAQQERERRLETARRYEIEALASTAGTVAFAREVVERLDRLNDMSDAELAATRLELELDIERSGGEASELILAARADRWAQHMSARAQAAEFEGHRIAYAAGRELYQAQRYFQAMGEALANARVYLTPEDLDLHLRFNLEDTRSVTDVFNPETSSPD